MKISRQVLNQKRIEAIEKDAEAGKFSARKEIPDAITPGLYFVVQPTGALSWAVRYRYLGKPRKLTLGQYPKVGLGLARNAAAVALRQVSEGTDPSSDKDDVKAELPADAKLVSSVLDDFVKRHVKIRNRESYVTETVRIIESELKPVWKHKNIQDIKKRDIVQLLDNIVDRPAPVMANRVRALLSKFFAWAMERDVVDASPVSSTRAPSPETTRDRILNDDEIRLLWKACDKVGYPFGPMVKLLLLTGQRRSEVSGASRKEFDLAGNDHVWTIPPERAKNNSEHFVPLSASAVLIIDGLPKIHALLFTTTGETPVSGFSKAKKAIDEAMTGIATEEAIGEAGFDGEGVVIFPWTLHDLRRTAASGMARVGIAVHVVEAVLNHRSGSIKGVAAVYNRYDYADEKREALTVWATAVEKIVSG